MVHAGALPLAASAISPRSTRAASPRGPRAASPRAGKRSGSPARAVPRSAAPATKGQSAPEELARNAPPWADALARMAEATRLPLGGSTQADFAQVLLDGSMLYAFVCSLGLGVRALNELLLEHVASQAAKAGLLPGDLVDPRDLTSTAGLERALACVIALHERHGQLADAAEAERLAAEMADKPTIELSADELVPLKLQLAPCRIADAAQRAISLPQLEGIAEVVRERCAAGKKWWARDEKGQLVPTVLEAEEVNLYHFVETITKPATRDGGGSLVEWMTTGPQRPHVFLSHYWGDPIISSVACVRDYMALCGLDAESTRLWVCAHANDQHDLSNLDVAPRDSPFYEAIGMSSAVLAIVDPKGEMLTRAWCVFEAESALNARGSAAGDTAISYDIVTRFGYETIALTTGPIEGEDAAARQEREGRFPPLLAAKAIGFSLADARASKASDLAAILGAIADQGRFESTVRARFFLSALPAISRSALWLAAGLRALRDSQLAEVRVDFASIAGLPARWATDALLPCLPPALQRLELARCELRADELVDTVRRHRAMQSLVLRETALADGDVATLVSALCELHTPLVALSLENNHVGDEAAKQLVKLLSARPSSLEHLDLTGAGLKGRTAMQLAAAIFGKGPTTLRTVRLGALVDVRTVGALDVDWDAASAQADYGALCAVHYHVVAQLVYAGTLNRDDLGKVASGWRVGGQPLPELVLAGQGGDGAVLGLSEENLSSADVAVIGWCAVAGLVTSLNLRECRPGLDAGRCELLAEALELSLSLIALDLCNNEVADVSAIGFGKALEVNKSLTELDLSENKIADAGAIGLGKALEVNESLTELNLGSNNLADAAALALADMLKVNASLTELKLSKNKIADKGAIGLGKALEVNESLTELDLSDNQIADAGTIGLGKALEVNASLTELHLSKNAIADAGAIGLGKALNVNESLTDLSLQGNQVADAGALGLSKALEVNASLTDLDLSKNKIADAGAIDLGKALDVNESLTWLNLGSNNLADAAALALADMLKVNESLTDLSLQGNQIADAGAIALGKALAVNASLTELDLSENEITDKGAIGLGKALKVNESLTELNLSSNKIADTGATGLAEGLKVNSSLTLLVLEDAKLSDAAALALADMLKVNASLTELDLSENQIGDKGAIGLGMALKVNASLAELNLWGNQINDAGTIGLAEGLKVNASLTSLYFDDEYIREAPTSALKTAWLSKPGRKQSGLH